MALTRTKFSQSDTTTARIQDPITVLNSTAGNANVDVGFLINRNNGGKSNVAVYWNETASEFNLAFTGNTGSDLANITVTNYSNLRADSFYGNLAGGTNQANVFVTGSIIPSSNVLYDLGSADKRFRSLWISGSTVYMGEEQMSVDANRQWAFTSNGSTFLIGETSYLANLTVTGNLTIQGTQFVANTTDVAYIDSVLELHTQSNLAPLTSDDGRDIGLKFHYYKTQDEHAFLGWSNNSGYLEWYDSGREGVGNVFTGNTYGTIKSGVLILANATPSTSTTSGALRVAGGAGISGNINVGGNLFVGTTNVISSITTIESNVGAYQIYANANLASQAATIEGIVSTANSNTAGYLASYTGNISAGNVTITANLVSDKVYSNGVFWYGNGEPIGSLSLAGSTGDILYNTGSGLGATNLKYFTPSGNIVLATGTQSTNVDSGALVVKGGLGVVGNIFAGGINGTIYGQLYLGTTAIDFNRTSGDIIVDGFNITGTATTADRSTKSQITNNVAVGTSYIAFVERTSGNAAVNVNSALTYDPNSGTLSPYALIVTTGNTVIAATTNSTSTDTGALVVKGGAGISGVLFIQNVGDVSANIGTIRNTLNSFDANVGTLFLGNVSTQANIGTLFLGNASTQANIGSIRTQLTLLDANVGAFQDYANANVGSIRTQLTTLDANVGVLFLGNASTQANVGIIRTQLTTLDANVGAFQTYANANIGTLFLGNASTQANIGTIRTQLTTLDANVGAYEIYANTSIGAIQANIGAFYNYANTKIGTNTNSNLVVQATTTSTSTTTGALVVGGGIGVAGNVFANELYTTNGIRWAGNGAVFSSGAGGGGGGITYTASNTAPVSPSVGDQWYYIAGDVLFQYINDGDSDQWVDIFGNAAVGTTAATSIGNAQLQGNISVLLNSLYSIGSPVGYLNNLYSNNIVANTFAITGNITTSGWIIPTSNVSQNLGTSTNWWGTFYGVSTQAQYADLAENYVADQYYEPGTVLIFGGDKEVTISDTSHDYRVAGVVSTDPAYLMNAASGNISVALTGRVPCRVLGPVGKGTLLVTSSIPGVAEALNKTLYQPGCIIGKSLDTVQENTIQFVEVAVGRF